MEQIACKECTSPDCHGCNMYRLERMLMSGKLNALMDENRAIKMDADVRPVMLCRDCSHADYSCMGNGTVWCMEIERAMQETDFCSRGKREES